MTRVSRLGLPLASPVAAAGWRASALVPASGLLSANGIRFGPDKRLYIAQAFGSQITALDMESGDLDLISASGGPLVSPDDVAFDSRGNLFATEFMNARVGMRRPNGKVEVVSHDMPAANGLTVHQDRVIVSEYRHGGRILEISDGTAPRVVADDLMYPNALCVGPDGYVYYPLAIPGGEIWRTPLEGGTPEQIAGGLSVPTAVKFGPNGRLFFTEAGTGTLNAIDLGTGRRSIIATTAPGVDNLDFETATSVIISNWSDGSIVRIDSTTGARQTVLAGSMLGPFGLAALPDGALLAADGLTTAVIGPEGLVSRPIVMIQPDAPPWMVGIAAGHDGMLAFTSPCGVACSYRLGEGATELAKDLDQPVGIAVTPAGDVLVCEARAGRIVRLSPGGDATIFAQGLQRPLGIGVSPDGRVFVSDATSGQLLEIEQDGTVTVLMRGLQEPHGVAAISGSVYVFDAGQGVLHVLDIKARSSSIVVEGLASNGSLASRRNTLPGLPDGPMAGPLVRFCGVAAFPDGRVCVACEADGSIWDMSRAANQD